MFLKVRFQVSGWAECLNCPAHGRDREAGFFAEEIVTEDHDAARDVFLNAKRLCKRCLPGRKVNLQFVRERLSVIEGEKGNWQPLYDARAKGLLDAEEARQLRPRHFYVSVPSNVLAA